MEERAGIYKKNRPLRVKLRFKRIYCYFSRDIWISDPAAIVKTTFRQFFFCASILFSMFTVSFNNYLLFRPQSNKHRLDSLNQRAQDLIKQADASNHNRIDEETAQINARWTKKLTDLEANIEKLNVLGEHWQDFDKRIALFENQLIRLEERCQNVDTAIKSKQQLDDTKTIYQVSVDCRVKV